MNRDEVTKLAQDCGWIIHEDMPYMDVQAVQDALIDRLERFAHLVAEYERESCAKMCEEFPYDCLGCLDDCAAAIRSRSNT